MKKIEIKISDNLTPLQEAAEIARQFAKKSLSFNDVKRIGEAVTVSDLQTTIIVSRVSNEKPIELVRCSCCGTDYQKGKGKPWYHNYGGSVRRNEACSPGCADAIVGLVGERSGRTSNSIKAAIFF